MGIGLVCATAAGRAAARTLAGVWPRARMYDGPVGEALRRAFAECDGVVCFLAVGATVRLLAPLLADKRTDPGVVCVDEAGRYVVPVVGGHAGGANALAERVAAVLGCTPVITTASDAAGAVALDGFGADLGFRVEPGSDLAGVGAAVLSGERVTLTMEPTWPVPPLPPNVVRAPAPEPGVPAIVVTDRADPFADAGRAAPFADAGRAAPHAAGSAGDTGNAAAIAAERTGNAAERTGSRATTDPESFPALSRGTPRPSIVAGCQDLDQGVNPILGKTAVVYRPRSLVVGVGASRGVSAREVGALIDEALADAGLSPLAVRHIATVDVKADEPGILAAAAERGWPVVTYPPDALAAVPVPHPSERVRRAVGTPSVAEAAALLGAARPPRLPAAAGAVVTGVPADGPGTPDIGDLDLAGAGLVVAKRASANATVAVARLRPRGRLTYVGLGPGSRDLLTPAAVAALRRASVIVGLDQYVEQVRDLIRPGTRVLTSRLGAEEERARTAVAQARQGHAVALVGSGDAGVYAMAGPALEFADAAIDVAGVPGISAAPAAAALLGAPLAHDHAVISLSDLHTPWEVIERRVRAAAEADFVVAFYNPRSRARDWQLSRALEILAAHRPPDTPVGAVRNAGRPGQRVTLTTLARFDPADVDMSTVVLVGCTRSRIVAGRFVTPRGYRWSPAERPEVSAR